MTLSTSALIVRLLDLIDVLGGFTSFAESGLSTALRRVLILLSPVLCFSVSSSPQFYFSQAYLAYRFSLEEV